MASLGQRLLELWGSKSTYTQVGWQARLNKLIDTRSGYQAADQVGLSVSQLTLRRWLAYPAPIQGRSQSPSLGNRKLIDQAFLIAAGRVWRPRFETAGYAIKGIIDTGDRPADQMFRTLRVGDGDYQDAKWDRIRAEFESSNPDPDTIEDLFIEDVIEEDIGPISGGWEFPGADYDVSYF